jgi:hypothetical protein
VAARALSSIHAYSLAGCSQWSVAVALQVEPWRTSVVATASIGLLAAARGEGSGVEQAAGGRDGAKARAWRRRLEAARGGTPHLKDAVAAHLTRKTRRWPCAPHLLAIFWEAVRAKGLGEGFAMPQPLPHSAPPYRTQRTCITVQERFRQGLHDPHGMSFRDDSTRKLFAFVVLISSCSFSHRLAAAYLLLI